jgi:hypothetical protein
MTKLMKFRDTKVPVTVWKNGEITVSLIVSSLRKEFFITELEDRKIYEKLLNRDEDLPEWEPNIYSFPSNTLPIIGKMKQVGKYIERDFKGFQMI